MYDFQHLLMFFMFYAVVGWCTEVIYKTVCTGKFVNRGFLNGPLCPIYGVGVTIVILCLTPLQDNLLILYVGSVLLTSGLEFVTGFVLEKVFHQKWWDYTDEHFNLGGYVCLKFSLAWGLACVFVMRIVQPFVLFLIDKIPELVQFIIYGIFYGLMVADLVLTIVALAKITLKLKLANDIDTLLNKIAEGIGTKLSDGTIKGMAEINEQKEKIGEQKEALGNMISEGIEKLDENTEKLEGKLAEGIGKLDDVLNGGREKLEVRKELLEAGFEEGREKLGGKLAKKKARLDAKKVRMAAKRNAKLRKAQQRVTALQLKVRKKYGDYDSSQFNRIQKRLEKAFPNLNLSRLSSADMTEKFEKLMEKFQNMQ